MHLGPEAMKIIGESIAHDIAANGENSWFAHDIETTYGEVKEPRPEGLLTEIPPANTLPIAAQATH